MCDSVPSLRYFSVCNVLRQWRILLIPTYGIYLLYDNNPNNTHIAAIMPSPLTMHPQSWQSCLHLDLNTLYHFNQTYHCD